MNQKELNEIEDICNKWLIPNINFDSRLNEIYKSLKDTNFNSIINSFTLRLKEIDYEFTESEKVSGSICFFGSVFTSLLNTGKIEEIEGLFTFALCYMLIDHFLDDVKNTNKEKTMKEIYDFLVHNKETQDNKLIQAAKERYLNLISKNPKCKESIILLFQSELEGVKISKRRDFPREKYKYIAEKKGGRTSSVIAQIIGIKNDETSSHYLCGTLIQFVDDILDIKDDEKMGIYTLARYDLDHEGLNRYVYETFLEIDKLDSVYNFFKVILLTGIILGIHDNPNSISSNLSKILQKYDPFNETTSKDSLNDWFHEKLYGYIESQK